MKKYFSLKITLMILGETCVGLLRQLSRLLVSHLSLASLFRLRVGLGNLTYRWHLVFWQNCHKKRLFEIPDIDVLVVGDKGNEFIFQTASFRADLFFSSVEEADCFVRKS